MNRRSINAGIIDRKKYLVKKELQVVLSGILAAILILGFVLSAVTVLFMTSGNLTASFNDFQLSINRTNDYLLPLLLSCNGLLCVLGLILVFFVVIKRTHRVVGPLVNLNQFLNRLRENGDLSQQFKIRENDQLQEIAASLNKLQNDWHGRIYDIKTEVDRLKELIDTFEFKKEECESFSTPIAGIAHSIQKKLNFYKT